MRTAFHNRGQAFLGAIQFWLQGWPDKRRPWVMVSVGNRLSEFRFWWFQRTIRAKEGNNAPAGSDREGEEK